MAALEQAGLEWLNKNLQPFLSGAQKGSSAMEQVGDAAERSSTRTSVLQGAVMGVANAMTTALIGAATKAGQAVFGLAQESVALAGEFQGMASALTIAAGDMDSAVVARELGAFRI